jgi:hypothetical protein
VGEFVSTTAEIFREADSGAVIKLLRPSSWLMVNCPGESIEEKVDFLRRRYWLYRDFFGDQLCPTEYQINCEGIIVIRQPFIEGIKLSELKIEKSTEKMNYEWVRLVKARIELAKSAGFLEMPSYFQILLYSEINEDTSNIILTSDEQFVIVDW